MTFPETASTESSFLLPLSSEPPIFFYVTFYVITIPWRTHSVWGWFRRSIISEEMLSESIFCLKSCWWLLVSTKGCSSVRKHQWYPLPLLPASWLFPIDCNKKSFIFPYRGITRHGSIHWTKNSKGSARIIWWQ